MKFAEFKLKTKERLICDKCSTLIKGSKHGTIIYLHEAIRTDAPAIGEIYCLECMNKLRVRVLGTDIKIIIVNES